MKALYRNVSPDTIVVLTLSLGGLLLALMLTKSIYIGALLCCVSFILMTLIPEIPLAIQVNGTIIYFFVLYRLGMQPRSMLTGVFNGFLLMAYLMGGIWLYYKGRISLNRIDRFFTMFCFWALLSFLFFSMENETALWKIKFLPFFVIGPYLGVRLFSTPESLERLLTYCVLVSAVMIIPSLLVLGDPKFSETARFSPFMFAKGAGLNPTLFGYGMGFQLIILMAWWLTGKIHWRNAWWLALVPPAIFLLIRAGGRGPVLWFLVSSLIMVTFNKASRLRQKVWVVLCLALLGIAAYFLIPDSTRWVYSSAINFQESRDRSIEGRIELQQAAIKDFVENPVLGVGFGNSALKTGFPHNIIIEVAAEFGLFGLALFLAMFLTSLSRLWKLIRRGTGSERMTLPVAALGLFTFSFGQTMTSGMLTNQILLFFSLGFIVSITEQRSIGLKKGFAASRRPHGL